MTASAITCAVECRSTSRPSSDVGDDDLEPGVVGRAGARGRPTRRRPSRRSRPWRGADPICAATAAGVVPRSAVCVGAVGKRDRDLLAHLRLCRRRSGRGEGTSGSAVVRGVFRRRRAEKSSARQRTVTGRLRSTPSSQPSSRSTSGAVVVAGTGEDRARRGRRALRARAACRGRRRSRRARAPRTDADPVRRSLCAAASEPVQERDALFEIGVVPLEAVAVVVAQQREADRARVGRLQQVADEDEVAERLRHLLALVVHHRRVQPVPHERLAGDRLALRDLALVVREDEVGAAAVQVERRPVLVHRHRRALDVPTGPADAERRAPRGLVRERRLPQHEVERGAPVRVVGVAAACPGELQHLLLAVVRQLPEAVRTTTRRSTRCRAVRYAWPDSSRRRRRAR